MNPGLTAAQIATIANNLPVVNTFGPPPVQAIDDTLVVNFQTFFCPFTISFPNLNAFNALNPHQVAIVTLTASLTVQIPTGANNATTPFTLTARANIELAKGEDPYFVNLNPTSPQAFPSWLSFDLRLFKVTANQAHQMFSVANPTTADPSSANGPIAYIQAVLNHLNNPSLITNGDTFDSALAQDEDSSALEFLPTNNAGQPVFNFAVARVRLTSGITTTVGPVRVFFRLLNAASTNSTFTEVGTGAGTYRWGTNGTLGHKIALLGVERSEFVAVPCFATERVNLNQPADMKTQTDPPNVQMITTVPGQEVDTYFGCWLDVNQTTPFMILIPPFLQSAWDGPWTGTESLSARDRRRPAPVSRRRDPVRRHSHSEWRGLIDFGQTRATKHRLAGRPTMTAHPFDIKASASANPPDELMITWGNMPKGSVASIYLPAVASADIIALANSMYGTHRLSATDAHTIQCPSGNVTLVPVPQGQGRYAGLLSVDLPRRVVAAAPIRSPFAN